MRTDRSRILPSTRQLLQQEEEFLNADRTGGRKDLPSLFRKLHGRIAGYSRVRTSREVDEFLQNSMIYLAARLHFDFRKAKTTKTTEFRVSTSVYSPGHNLFVMKPSYFFPGRCSLRHPTILFTRSDADDYGAEATPHSRDVGLSGLALSSGEVLHCTRLQGISSCPYYVPLESRSASALAVPLTTDLAGTLDRFLSATAPVSDPGPHCCACTKTVHNFPLRKNGAPTYCVVNFDCSTGELKMAKAQRILADAEIQQVLGLIVDRLAGYQSDRPAYRVLRNCTALFQLSQHTLEARQAFVALLREISLVCDGADVTLHLREIFDHDHDQDHDHDHDRGVRLVDGFGPRFRGFLIGERYGDGLVGEAMSGQGQFKSLDAEEINSAVSGKHPYSYRRLIPGTALNAALPIRFHTRIIGALNIEWDERLIAKIGFKETDNYLEGKQVALERLAEYFALVVDYFDDLQNESLKPPEDLAREWGYVGRSTSRRRVLAYYVDSALQRIDSAIGEKERDALMLKHLYLRDIIDAVGYFLTFEDKHRILASVRRRVRKEDTDVLDLVYAHGFDPEKNKTKDRDLGPGGPIPIVAGKSVLGTCADLGVAVFGRVEDGQVLRPDRLCEDCAPKVDRVVLRQTIRYLPAGRRPVYEVGVPLVFGGNILGTFDFELFSVDFKPSERRAPEENVPTALAGHELAAFLEWTRAITFCMAYAEDALNSESALAKLGDEQRSAFRRFQRLCAQIVANVAIPQDLLTPIAREYIRGLIPLGELELVPGTGDGGAEITSAQDTRSPEPRRNVPLWWRGERLGTIGMTLEDDLVPPRSVFPETSLLTGTSLLAQRFIGAFYTAALSSQRGSEFDSSEFKNALGSVQSAFAERIEALKRDAEEFTNLSPYALIDKYFCLFHHALQRMLPESRSSSTARQPSRHGWFLYMAQCVEDSELGEAAVLRCGKPFERWVAMDTHEMKALVSRALESQDPEKALRQILGETVAEDILAGWHARPGSAYSVESLEELFLEALAWRGRDYPDPRREQGSSLIASTVTLKRVLPVIDLNRNPVRSERKSGWFFGDKAYSLICVPILLNERAIGVLQIFRRRDAIDDILFFKNDEIDMVGKLGKTLEDAIASEIDCLLIPIPRADAADAGFTHEVNALGERLRERIAQGQKGLVSCDFLAEPTACERFLNCYVGRQHKTYTTHELLNQKKLELMDLSIVCIVHTGERPTLRLRERMATLTGPVGAPIVILFVSHAAEHAMVDLLPADSFFERQEIDDPAEVLRVAFGLAEGQAGHEREAIGILLRRSGAWTIARVVAACSEGAGVIRNNAKIVLKDLQARSFIPRRMFPDWYQSVEGAIPPPQASSAPRGKVRSPQG